MLYDKKLFTKFYNNFCLYKVSPMRATYSVLIGISRQYFTSYQIVCFSLKKYQINKSESDLP